MPLLTGEAGKTQEQLSYKIVRPSQVTAQLIGPDGGPRVLEAGVQHVPGSYSFTYSTFDVEGTWHWNVTATDDLKRVSTIDRAFRYDTTLRGLSAPEARARDRGDPVHALAAREREAAHRDADRRARSRRCRPVSLPAGAQSVVWDGRLPHGSRAYGGSYVAHVFVTSSVGTSDSSRPFSFRRAS